MQYLRISILFILTVLFFTCESDYKGSYSGPEAIESRADMSDHLEMEPPRTATPPPPPGSEGQKPNLPTNRKIIYTGSIRMQVDSLSLSMAQVTELVNRAGGFISSQHVTNDHYEKEAKLILRLPVEGFQPAMNSVTELAKFVNSQNLDSRDVSAQWIDLESRLKTKRDVRDRYIEVLRKRAVKVEDILAAEEKIRVITEEIEAKEGRLRYLRDQVSMSTLELTMYQTQEYRSEPDTYRKGFGQKIIDSLAGGFEFIQVLLLFAVSIWPLYFLVPVLVWVYRKWKR
jgi:hypothetical protein